MTAQSSDLLLSLFWGISFPASSYILLNSSCANLNNAIDSGSKRFRHFPNSIVAQITNGVLILFLLNCFPSALSLVYSDAVCGSCSQKYMPSPNQSHGLLLEVRLIFPFNAANPIDLSQLWSRLFEKVEAVAIYLFLFSSSFSFCFSSLSSLSLNRPASARYFMAVFLDLTAFFVAAFNALICC